MQGAGGGGLAGEIKGTKIYAKWRGGAGTISTKIISGVR
jgi:hypothetical protein